MELISDARDGLNGAISLYQLLIWETHHTVLTIMLSRSIRKLTKATAATMTYSLNPVTYSRSGIGFKADGSSFTSALAGSVLAEAVLGGEVLSREELEAAIASVLVDKIEIMSGW
jgi:hypothetical protein